MMFDLEKARMNKELSNPDRDHITGWESTFLSDVYQWGIDYLIEHYQKELQKNKSLNGYTDAMKQRLQYCIVWKRNWNLKLLGI